MAGKVGKGTMESHRTGFVWILAVLILVVSAEGIPLSGPFCSPLDAAESAALPLVVSIPEYLGVHVKGASVSMVAMIGGKPAESSFSFLLSSTGNTPRKLTARLAAPLPAGMSMTVEVPSAQGGRSTGPQPLGTGEVDLLTGFRGLFGAGGRGMLKMKGSNSLAPGAGQAVLVLAVRDM